MERIMNEENDWDHSVEADNTLGHVSREVVQVLSDKKTGNTPVHSQVSLELIAASGGVEFK